MKLLSFIKISNLNLDLLCKLLESNFVPVFSGFFNIFSVNDISEESFPLLLGPIIVLRVQLSDYFG